MSLSHRPFELLLQKLKLEKRRVRKILRKDMQQFQHNVNHIKQDTATQIKQLEKRLRKAQKSIAASRRNIKTLLELREPEVEKDAEVAALEQQLAENRAAEQHCMQSVLATNAYSSQLTEKYDQLLANLQGKYTNKMQAFCQSMDAIYELKRNMKRQAVETILLEALESYNAASELEPLPDILDWQAAAAAKDIKAIAILQHKLKVALLGRNLQEELTIMAVKKMITELLQLCRSLAEPLPVEGCENESEEWSDENESNNIAEKTDVKE